MSWSDMGRLRGAATALALCVALAGTGCGGSEGGGPEGAGTGGGGSGASDAQAGDSGDSGMDDSGASGGDGGADADASGGMAGTSASQEDAGPEPDAGAMPEPAFPPDEDADGDSLDNGTELLIGTDPRYRDTDMDGVADDVEVGPDLSSALDDDSDGVPDALEHPRFDNDRDGVFDDVDASEGVQIVYGRFVGAVLANDGRDSVRFELKVVGGAVQSASVGMSAIYHRDEWAPDELAVDGELLGDDALELFDDGTHGDVIADDQVFSRGGITTEMAIRGEFGRDNGQRCRVVLNEVRLTTNAGPTSITVGVTDEVMPSLLPDVGFWLPILDAALVPTVEAIPGVGQRASHVLNVVDAELAVTLAAFLMEGPNGDPLDAERLAVVHSLTASALAALDADFDFIYAFTSEPVYTSLAGSYFGLSNDASGIGRPVQAVSPDSGSAGRLRGIINLRMAIDFPLNHETMHSWGVQLEPLLGTGEGHWGTVGTFGVLGGFDPASLVDHSDGTFTVGHFSEGGNEWLTTRFSPIELYLAGLVPAADIAPIPVLDDIAVLTNDASGVTISATRTTVAIDDIVAMFGARSPASADARKDFAALFVLFSERVLTPAELGLIDHVAAAYEQPSVAYGISFEDATGGRATMTTALP